MKTRPLEAIDANRAEYSGTVSPRLAEFFRRMAARAGITADVMQRSAVPLDNLLRTGRAAMGFQRVIPPEQAAAVRRMEAAEGAQRLKSAFNKVYDDVLDGEYGQHAQYFLRYYDELVISEEQVADAIEEAYEDVND